MATTTNSAIPAQEDEPSSDVKKLQELISDQVQQLKTLIGEIQLNRGSISNSTDEGDADNILDVLNAAVKSALDTAAQLTNLPDTPSGVAAGIRALQAYMVATSDVASTTLALFLMQFTAYRALMSARLDLIATLTGLASKAGPQLKPGGDIADFTTFSTYLKDQARAIASIRDSGADLPSETLLKDVLQSWERVISGLTSAKGLTQADFVEKYVAVDSQVNDLILGIDDLVGERNLLDPTIL